MLDPKNATATAPDSTVKGWEESVARIKHAVLYGLYCNDMSLHEVADDVCFAIDQLAELNGLPPVSWEEDYAED